MTKHPVAVLNAKKCILKEDFERSRLAQQWLPFSFNLDQRGKMFVSAVEHDRMPFYGTLFHSEKIPFEWLVQGDLATCDEVAVELRKSTKPLN